MAGKGKHRNKGIGFDYAIFEDYAERLEAVGGDLKEIFTDLLEQTAETVEWDTKDALANKNLPRAGKYSTGDTLRSVVSDARVTWTGSIAEIPLGFDYNKKGAGGFLITGTPRMRPDYALESMYAKKKYNRDLIRDMFDYLEDQIKMRMET